MRVLLEHREALSIGGGTALLVIVAAAIGIFTRGN